MSLGYQRCTSCKAEASRCQGCGAFMSVVVHDHSHQAFLCDTCLVARMDEIGKYSEVKQAKLKAGIHPVEYVPDPEGSPCIPADPADPRRALWTDPPRGLW